MEKETIEQLIRSFGWYVKVATATGHCVLDKDDTKTCLDALKGLNEANESYRQELGEVRIALAEANKERQRLTEENEKLRNAFSRYEEYTGMNLLKAETVRKMQEKLKGRFNVCNSAMYYEPMVHDAIDQIAKEMLKEFGYET